MVQAHNEPALRTSTGMSVHSAMIMIWSPKIRHFATRRTGLLRALTFVTVGTLSCAAQLHASEADNPVWRSFQHALGDVPLIGANADHELADNPWRPVPEPASRPLDTGRFQLGADLFHEGRLSSANSVACVTCHAGALSGADRRPVSTGVGGARGTKNALTVFNAGFNFRQFWDGRAVTLEDQALEPIGNPVEMAHSLDAVLEMLQSDEEYQERFAAVYPDGVTISNMADAIAYFQRVNFVRLDTPFQRFLNGEEQALDEPARRGMRRFDRLGCTSCHNGINLGGNSYQKLGAAVPYYGDERQAGPHDTGVMDRSGRERDRHVFRVQGLHGVATTSPYFHDGSVGTLEQAIVRMAKHQLGRQLDQQDVEDIEAFLRSLGGYVVSSAAADATSAGAEAGGEESAASRPSRSHHEAYLATIEALETAVSRLLPQMERIHDGDVAHFDFLQFEHLQLIRFARALHYPPTFIDEQTRADLLAAAEALLADINQLEWTIADFLRAEAMIRVFSAQQDTAGAAPTLDAAGSIPDRLSEYRALSMQAMEDIASIDPVTLAAGIRALYPVAAQ